jgi:hypothetical protein
VWLGLTDSAKEGEWRFVSSPYSIYNNTALPEYFDWHKGEPNNAYNHEHCAQIWKEEGYQWNDQDCTQATAVSFCQKPANPQ